MLPRLSFSLPQLRQLRIVTWTPPREAMNPLLKRDIIARLNASSLLSVTLALCDKWLLPLRQGGEHQWGYEVYEEHSFTRSSLFGTNVEINVGTGMHEL